MSDWNGWPEDGPDFDSADTADLRDYGDESGYPEEGFGSAGDDLPDDDGPGDVPGPGADGDDPGGDAAAGPIGYGGIDAHVDEPLDPGQPDDAGPEPAAGDEGPRVGFGSAEAPVGADPDLAPHADGDSWPVPSFPEALDLELAPEPVDGFPWTDPAVLGEHGDSVLADPVAAYTGGPDVAELADYAGDEVPAGGDAWAALANSPDPATSSLARWWSPNLA